MLPPSLRRFTAVLGAFAAVPALVHAAGPLSVDVVTYHNDAAVTGQYSHEFFLNRANVNATTFGKKFDLHVDGQMYAQPLYVAGLPITGQGRHNVVFAATEHDSVYAFDADSGKRLWYHSFLGTKGNGTVIAPVPNTELPGHCGQITPELGVTATPALDRASGTLYVAAMTKETSADGKTVSYFQRLHALDLHTGQEKTGSPVAVEAAVPGTGDGGTTVTFDPLFYKERPGLVLVNGVVYTSWSSHCDVEPYHGWIIGYDARTLKQVNVYNVTANGTEASFWDGGATPAVDAANNIFIGAGNGTFDKQNDDGSLNPDGVNLGESYIRLSTSGNHLTPQDWFTPFNKNTLNDNDRDTGSAGTILYDVGNRHLAASAGKEGRIYILNRDNLGHYSPNADTGAVQSIPRGAANGLADGLFGCPAFFQSVPQGPTLYFSAINDYLKAYVLDASTGQIGAISSQSPEKFSYPGTVPSISSHTGTMGIVWAMDSSAVLHAYNADSLSTELYHTGQAANGRDALGSYVKFSAPVIAQGRVYAGTADHLGVYGLLNPAAAADVTSQVSVQVVSSTTSGHATTQKVSLVNHGSTALSGPLSLVVDKLSAVSTLTNASGTTTLTIPRASFYLNAGLTGGTLPAGGSVTATLKFSTTTAGGTAPSYTARVLAGGGAR